MQQKNISKHLLKTTSAGKLFKNFTNLFSKFLEVKHLVTKSLINILFPIRTFTDLFYPTIIICLYFSSAILYKNSKQF